MKSTLAQLTSIEGKASNVRQSHATVAWGNSCRNSYECLFRLSDTPVALRVNSPIFIEDGETVRLVGSRNLDGVFDAVAYHNQSSGGSGMAAWTWPEQKQAIFAVVSGGLLVFFVVFFAVFSRTQNMRVDTDTVLYAYIGIGLPGGMGLVLVLWGVRTFVRYRNEIRTIEKLLNDE